MFLGRFSKPSIFRVILSSFNMFSKKSPPMSLEYLFNNSLICFSLTILEINRTTKLGSLVKSFESLSLIDFAHQCIFL